MKKTFSWIVLAALAALTAVASWKLATRGGPTRVPPLAVGAPAPDFKLADLAGRTFSLSDYKGQVVLINFWATWCPSCREELPALDALYRKYRGKGFILLAPSVDVDGRKALLPFLADYNPTFPILLCDPKTAGAYQVYGLPSSFLIDARGRLSRAYIGALTPSLTENDILNELKRRNS